MKLKKISLSLITVVVLIIATLATPALATSEHVVYVNTNTAGDSTTDNIYASLNDAIDAINAAKTTDDSITGGKIILDSDIAMASGGDTILNTCTVPLSVVSKDSTAPKTIKIGDSSKKRFLYCSTAITFDDVIFKQAGNKNNEIWSGKSLTIGDNVRFLNNAGAVATINVWSIRCGFNTASTESVRLELNSGTLCMLHLGNDKGIGDVEAVINKDVTVTQFLQVGGTSTTTTKISTGNVTASVNGATIGDLWLCGYGPTPVTSTNITLTDATINGKIGYNRKNGSPEMTSLSLSLDNTTVAGSLDNMPDVNTSSLTLKNQTGTLNSSLSGWKNIKLINSIVQLNTAYAGPTDASAVSIDANSKLIVPDGTSYPDIDGIQEVTPKIDYVVYINTNTAGDSTTDNIFASLNDAIDAINAAQNVNDKIIGGKIILDSDISMSSGSDTILNTCTVPLSVVSKDDTAPKTIKLGDSSKKRFLYCSTAITFDDVIFKQAGNKNVEIWSGKSLTIGENVSFLNSAGAVATTNVWSIRCGFNTASTESVRLELNSGTLCMLHLGNDKGIGDVEAVINKGVTVTQFLQVGGTSTTTTKISTGNVTASVNGATIGDLWLCGYGPTPVTSANMSLTDATINGKIGYNRKSDTPAMTSLSLSLDNTTVAGSLDNMPDVNTSSLTLKNQTGTLKSSLAGWKNIKLVKSIVELNTAYAGPTDASSVSIDANSKLIVPQGTSYPNIDGIQEVTPKVEYKEYHKYVDGNSFKLDTLISSGTSQGVAVYGDLLFKATNKGSCTVIDLKTLNQVGSFSFGSATSSGSGASANHSNSIMFGNQKFDKNDPFPLLYVCAGNSGDHISDGSTWGKDTVGSYYGHCAIERIIYNESTGQYSCETVQRIFFNDVDNIPVVNGDNLNANKLSTMRDSKTGAFYYTTANGYDASKGYQKVGWGWPAWCVDSDPTSDTYGKLYIYSTRYRTKSDYESTTRNFYRLDSKWNYFMEDGTGNAYIITEVNMPALPKSKSDPNYGGNVILYPKDITDQFTTRYDTGFTQGSTMYKGRMYCAYGASGTSTSKHNRNFLQIFDIGEKKLVGQIPLYNDAVTSSFEPECPAIWQGELMISMNPGVYVFNYVALDEPTVKHATCTEGGYSYAECALCGYNMKTLSTENALGHSFTNYVPDGNATCKADGTKTAVCDHDGCKESKTIADPGSNQGHKFTNYVSNNDATCNADGTKTAECDYKDCEEKSTITDPGSKLKHKFTNYVSDNNATCDANGTKTAECDYDNCNAKDTVEIPDSKREHKFTTYVSDDNATCDADGTKTAECDYDDCNAKNTVVISGSKREHKFTTYVSDNNATCKADGTKTAECDYDDCEEKNTVVDSGSKLKHKFTTYVSDNNATCKADGTKTAECDYDDCEEKSTVVDSGSKLKHKFTTYVSDDNATCKADGTKTAECDYDDCNEKNTVVDSGSKLKHKFTTYLSDDNATCKADGTKTAECEYDDCKQKNTVSDISSKLSHKLTKVDAKAATCTEEGVIEHYICSYCNKNFADADGKTEKSDVTIAAGHKISKVDGKAPTESENGYKEHYKCSACGKFYADKQGKTEITKDSVVISATGVSDDASNPLIFVWIIVILIAIAVITVLVVKRKRSK